MKALFSVFLLALSFTPWPALAEDLTITTYYPSPNGVYRTMRLFPGALPSGSCKEGELTYFNATGEPRGLYFCNSTSQWQQFTKGTPAGGGGAVSLGFFGGLYTHIIHREVTGVASCEQTSVDCPRRTRCRDRALVPRGIPRSCSAMNAPPRSRMGWALAAPASPGITIAINKTKFPATG